MQHNKIVKKDLSIIKEFLNTDTPQVVIKSPSNSIRTYSGSANINDLLVILTPMIQENADEIINTTFDYFKNYHKTNVKYEKHQRGKNLVYVFRKVA